jgi:hypothetical protein
MTARAMGRREVRLSCRSFSGSVVVPRLYPRFCFYNLCNSHKFFNLYKLLCLFKL